MFTTLKTFLKARIKHLFPREACARDLLDSSSETYKLLVLLISSPWETVATFSIYIGSFYLCNIQRLILESQSSQNTFSNIICFTLRIKENIQNKSSLMWNCTQVARKYHMSPRTLLIAYWKMHAIMSKIGKCDLKVLQTIEAKYIIDLPISNLPLKTSCFIVFPRNYNPLYFF